MSKKNNALFNFGKTYTVPLAKEDEDKSKNIIQWGKDNLYPQWVNYIFYQCAVHQGIIQGKVFYTISAGLKETATNRDVINLVKPVLHGIDLNLELADCYYVKCRLSPDRTRIEKVQHVPYEWVRVTCDGNFRVSQDWTDSKVEIWDYPSYENKEEDDLTFLFQFKVEPMQQLVEFDKKDVTYNYYPVLPYSGAVKSILSDIEITNYTLSEVVNNFSLGTLLQLNNGEPKTVADREDLEDRILETATGSDNAGGVFITFGDGKDTEPTVVHLNGNQLHERYVTLSEDVRTNILRGHSVNSGELFGFDKGGNFNADTLDFAYWMFYETYIKVRQSQLLKFVNFVAKFNGVSEQMEFNKVEIPKIGQAEPTAQPQATFSKDDATMRVLAEFATRGVSKDSIEILAKESYNDSEPFKEVFAPALDEKGLQVLNLIANGESFDAIAKATGINPMELSKIFNQLKQGEHIDNDYKITRTGKLAVIRSDVKRMKIMYSYEVKPGYEEGANGERGEIISTTRDFCRELITLNRLYTREEIDQISAIIGTDVWRYRGGWYHNPNTNKNEPSCRHEWSQNLTFI